MRFRTRATLAVVLAVLSSLALGSVPAHAFPQHAGQARSHALSTPFRPSTVDLEMEVDVLAGPFAAVRTLADARSIRCRGCDATAVTLHVVLVDSPVREVRAYNRASSRNQLCTDCVTTAGSYQIVIGGPEPVALTLAGRQALADLEAQFESMPVSGTDALVEAEKMVDAAVSTLLENVEPRSVAAGPGLRTLGFFRPEVQVLRDWDTD